MSNKLKVLVVDDTIFYRKLLSNLMGEIPGIDLMGVASNGGIALKKIELSPPDLVLLDVVMPEMDGLEALNRIKADHPGVEVVMVSGADRQTAGLTVKALEAGALDFISKPKVTSQEDAVKELKVALTSIVAVAKTLKYSRDARKNSETLIQDKVEKITSNPVEHQEKHENACESATSSVEKREVPRIDIVVIGVSTGGPNVLKEIVPKIRRDFPVPILAVQHMPPVFTATLAESLDQMSAIKVLEGEAEQILENGVMYIAPGGRHMVVRKTSDYGTKLGIVDSPPVCNCRPAVDVLFRSAGMVFGSNVLTVILTGMGKDGAAGVAAIRRKGGYSIVQDESSSVVWGMPGTVVEAGDADEIWPADKIPRRIMELVGKGRWK